MNNSLSDLIFIIKCTIRIELNKSLYGSIQVVNENTTLEDEYIEVSNFDSENNEK